MCVLFALLYLKHGAQYVVYAWHSLFILMHMHMLIDINKLNVVLTFLATADNKQLMHLLYSLLKWQ